jgi:2-phospho-L-lactate guanylyltransferase (CobY/MobA/RfbA family)
MEDGLRVSAVEAVISADYDNDGSREQRVSDRDGGTSMDSLEQFSNNVRWTAAEKKVARRAFENALERHLSAITAEAKRMMANVADPSDLWQVEAYLTESRKTVDRIYQFRYSDLLRVFSILMRDEWLKEADLVGLQPEKIADITSGAESLRRILADQEK